MAVAVVIVTFNSAPEIGGALDSLPRGTEVVVVDNASTDHTAREVSRRGPHITWVPLQKNVGFSRAVNLGVARCRADTLLLLNPDARLPQDAGAEQLARLEAALLQSGAAAMGPRLVDDDGQLQLSLGAWPSLCSEALRCLAQRQIDRRGLVGGWVRQSLARYLSRATPVPWVSAAALLVRRAAFMQIGGFDPGYFLYFEDIDFCLRLWHAGGQVLYAPEFIVYHARGRSAARAQGLAARAYRDSQARNARQYMHPHAARLVGHYAQRRKAQVGSA